MGGASASTATRAGLDLLVHAAASAGPSRSADFRRGVFDILPVLAAACRSACCGERWRLAKGFTPFEAWLTSATVFAGAAQFVAG
jgi:predicted branched-subunit amino acid permease